jgi:hypothetical protein
VARPRFHAAKTLVGDCRLLVSSLFPRVLLPVQVQEVCLERLDWSAGLVFLFLGAAIVIPSVVY